MRKYNIFLASLYRILKKKKSSTRRAKFGIYSAFFILHTRSQSFLGLPVNTFIASVNVITTSQRQWNKLQTHLIVNRSRETGIAAVNNEIERKETVFLYFE